MKNKLIFLSIFSLFFLSACDEEITLETIDELTIQAFLQAGQTVDTVKIGKVIPLDVLEATDAPDDLQPIIKNEAGEIFPLEFTGETGIYRNADLLIETDQVYSLELSYNNKLITAETYIPFAAQDLTLSENLIERAKIESFEDLQNQEVPDPIEVTWEGEVGAYYFVNVKNIEADPEPINELFTPGQNQQRPDFLSEPSTNNFYTINSFIDLTHFGKYEVIVFTVNPEYVALYEDNTDGTGSLNEIRTNVQNGYGIFTGINQVTLTFEVKKQWKN